MGSSFIISHGALSNITNERRETYSKSFTRVASNRFGFVAKCFSKSISSNQKITLKNLLYTIEGSKSYSLTSNAGWLKVTKNATGIGVQSGVYIEATADAAGLAAGTYTGTITVNGTGSGTSYTSASFCVNLTVSGGTTTDRQVVSFTLINADTDQDLFTLTNGATLNLATLPTKNLNIRANTNPATVGSVVFNLSGTQSRTQTESGAPYALFSNSGSDYNAWTPAVGSYTLRATPYSASGGTGTAGTALSIDFQVTNQTTAPSEQLITNISATTGRSYTLSELRTGSSIYTDRTYQATSIPSYLTGTPFIKTPNADKANTSTSVLSFKLTKDATVYVAYDPRATALPGWLSNWQKLSGEIGIDDPGISHLDLYSKSFPAGTVTLGGNLASPAAGALNTYIVVAKEQQSLTAARSGSLLQEQAKAPAAIQSLKLTVFPNPSSSGDKIRVALESVKEQETIMVIMYDALGRVLYSKSLVMAAGVGSVEIPTAKRINAGVYIIKAQTASGNKQTKVIIE